MPQTGRHAPPSPSSLVSFGPPDGGWTPGLAAVSASRSGTTRPPQIAATFHVFTRLIQHRTAAFTYTLWQTSRTTFFQHQCHHPIQRPRTRRRRIRPTILHQRHGRRGQIKATVHVDESLSLSSVGHQCAARSWLRDQLNHADHGARRRRKRLRHVTLTFDDAATIRCPSFRPRSPSGHEQTHGLSRRVNFP